ncbi:hypothetical protein B0J14DRAFT_651135 [Halenospora varia]|nr:hypothetical protein B0J14DRAFT_651135 [Halenospora varia]
MDMPTKNEVSTQQIESGKGKEPVTGTPVTTALPSRSNTPRTFYTTKRPNPYQQEVRRQERIRKRLSKESDEKLEKSSLDPVDTRRHGRLFGPREFVLPPANSSDQKALGTRLLGLKRNRADVTDGNWEANSDGTGRPDSFQFEDHASSKAPSIMDKIKRPFSSANLRLKNRFHKKKVWENPSYQGDSDNDNNDCSMRPLRPSSAHTEKNVKGAFAEAGQWLLANGGILEKGARKGKSEERGRDKAVRVLSNHFPEQKPNTHVGESPTSPIAKEKGVGFAKYLDGFWIEYRIALKRFDKSWHGPRRQVTVFEYFTKDHFSDFRGQPSQTIFAVGNMRFEQLVSGNRSYGTWKTFSEYIVYFVKHWFGLDLKFEKEVVGKGRKNELVWRFNGGGVSKEDRKKWIGTRA